MCTAVSLVTLPHYRGRQAAGLMCGHVAHLDIHCNIVMSVIRYYYCLLKSLVLRSMSLRSPGHQYTRHFTNEWTRRKVLTQQIAHFSEK